METPRETILASLVQFGGTLTMSQAAAKYGTPKGSIGKWAKMKREGKVVELKVAPPPEPDPTRARVAKSAEITVKARSYLTEAVSEALGPRIRENVRRTVDNLTAYLAAESERALKGKPDDVAEEDWRPVDMQQLRATANALESVLGRGADLLAFDKSTTAPSDRDALDDGDAVARELRARRG